MKKLRIDQYLVDHNFFPTLQVAKNAIIAGIVYLNQEVVLNASTIVKQASQIVVKEKKMGFVSRGGLKLSAALDFWQINLTNKICCDIGSSTGGFTDCMLQNHATKVYSIDVGTNQLVWKLRTDPRVEVMEKTNFRYFDQQRIKLPIDFAAIDVSYISIQKMIAPLIQLLKVGADVICLIKPQFECPRSQVIDGMVRSKTDHLALLLRLETFFKDNNLMIVSVIPSPILGHKKKNIEFLWWLKYQIVPKTEVIDWSMIVDQAWSKINKEV